MSWARRKRAGWGRVPPKGTFSKKKYLNALGREEKRQWYLNALDRDGKRAAREEGVNWMKFLRCRIRKVGGLSKGDNRTA